MASAVRTRFDLIQFVVAVVVLGHCCQLARAAVDLGEDDDDDDEPVGGFRAHLYDAGFVSLHRPQTVRDWLQDANRLFGCGSFTIAIHGVIGAGKSRLVARLTGTAPEQIAGTSHDGGLTTVTQSYAAIRNDAGTEQLFVIDTPGFGERSLPESSSVSHDPYVRQRRVLTGLDRASTIAADKYGAGAPLKRVYFLIDADRSRDIVPDTLPGNLDVMNSVYGADLADQLVFVVSKCDRLSASADFTRARCDQLRQRLARLYRQVFGQSLRRPQERVLFLSPQLTDDPCTTLGSMRNLVDDLARAKRTSGSSCFGDKVMPKIRLEESLLEAALIERHQLQERLTQLKREVAISVGVSITMTALTFVSSGGLAVAALGQISGFLGRVRQVVATVGFIQRYASMLAISACASSLSSATAGIVSIVDGGEINVATAKLNALQQICSTRKQIIESCYFKAA